MSGDLFGYEPPKIEARTGEVSLAMKLHHQTAAAWLLSLPVGSEAPVWVPKSQCSRGEGRDENVWTMPRSTAAERGWL